MTTHPSPCVCKEIGWPNVRRGRAQVRGVWTDYHFCFLWWVFSELMFINCTKLTFFAFYKLQNYMWVRLISLLFLRFKTHQEHPSPSLISFPVRSPGHTSTPQPPSHATVAFGPHLICEHRRTHFFLWIGPHLISLTLVLSCRSSTGPSPATRAPRRAILWWDPALKDLPDRFPSVDGAHGEDHIVPQPRRAAGDRATARGRCPRWPRHGRAPHASSHGPAIPVFVMGWPKRPGLLGLFGMSPLQAANAVALGWFWPSTVHPFSVFQILLSV
jgi:hypothetical protein